jgi:anti-anti-sigma factor
MRDHEGSPPIQALTVAVRHSERRAAVVVPVGEVDHSTAADFLAALDEAADGAELVVVDLAGVTFFSSRGLAALLALHSRVPVLRLAGVAEGGLVRRILSIARLDELIPSFPTVRDALAGAERDGEQRAP